jgi:O-antigen/teichoic acid export membrane protein
VRFWLNSERVVGARFAGQFLVASVSNYLIFYLLVLFVISVAAVGTIKLALLALGPVAVLSAGVQSALIPLASKRIRQDRDGALRFLFVAGMALALGAAAWAALLYVAPVHLVRSVLGPAWPQARLLVPFGGLSFMAMCVAGAGTCGLRAMRAAKENLRVALASLPVVIAIPIWGATVSGAHGYVVGATVAGGLYATAVWAVLLRTAKRLPADEAATRAESLRRDAGEGLSALGGGTGGGRGGGTGAGTGRFSGTPT